MKIPDFHQLIALVKRSVKGWSDDAAPSMGAALAFYTLLSLAPMLLVAVGVAGIFFDRNEAQNALITQIAMVLGEKAAVGVEMLLDAAGTRENGAMPAIIGLLTMLIGATTVFAEMRVDLDRIWRYQAPENMGLIKAVGTRLSAFLMVMGVGALLVLSLVASTVIASVGTQFFSHSPASMHAIEFVTSFVVITLLFAMIYKVLPSQHVAWGDVWVGAAVTSLLFWVGKFLIALYIGHTAVDSTFGAAGALVLVILWVYYSSQVFFLGAEFTKEYAIRHGSCKNDMRLQKPLAEMNASYEELVARAKQITRRNDPIFDK